MGLLKILFSVFVILFPVGEIGRLQFPNGVAITVNDVFLGVLVAYWFLLNFSKNKFRAYLTKPILIFSGVAFLSLALNFPKLSFDSFLISFSYLIRFIAYATVYFIFRGFDKEFKKKASYLLLLSGSIVVIGGFIQFFLYPNLKNLYYLGWDEHLYRMFSSFLDPNFAGAFFVIFLMYSLSFLKKFIEEKSWIKSFIISIISLVTLASIYLTYSRSALVMLIVSVVTFLVLISQKKLIAVSVVVLVLLIFLAPKSFKTEGTNFLRIASSEARLESVQVAYNIFQKNPVFGVGFNAYRYAQNKEGLNNASWQVTHSGAGTDNSFLFVLATTGIIGFVSYLYLLFKIFYLAKINLKKNMYSVILFSSLSGLLINSLFINSLFYVFILEWVWILASLTENN